MIYMLDFCFCWAWGWEFILLGIFPHKNISFYNLNWIHLHDIICTQFFIILFIFLNYICWIVFFQRVVVQQISFFRKIISDRI